MCCMCQTTTALQRLLRVLPAQPHHRLVPAQLGLYRRCVRQSLHRHNRRVVVQQLLTEVRRQMPHIRRIQHPLRRRAFVLRPPALVRRSTMWYYTVYWSNRSGLKAGVSTSRVCESPPGPLSISHGHVSCLKARAFPPPFLLCESPPAPLNLNIIRSCGLFEGKGVSTSRVIPPGSLSLSLSHTTHLHGE